MAHFLEKTHLLARLNNAVMFGLVGGGLAACVFGASAYDVGRWFSLW